MAQNDLRYKRDEPYRFEFMEPISANFKYTTASSFADQYSSSELKILDISLNGMKISTNLDIPLIDDVTISTSVKIGSFNFNLTGAVIWRKKITQSQYHYGIKLTSTSHQQYLKRALIEYKQAIKVQSE